MRARNREDFFATDDSGHILRRSFDSQYGASDDGAKAPPSTADDEVNGTPIPVGSTFNGVSDFTGDLDRYAVSLVAGHTYTFSLYGSGANPLNDTYLEVINPALNAIIANDDDGGNLLNSIITFTATDTATYFLRARAFANVGDPGIGTYSLEVREMGSDSVGDANGTAGTLDIGGQILGFHETSTDVDRYAVTLEAGQFYTFFLAGGHDYATTGALPPGELDTILRLRSADGTLLVQNDDNSGTDFSSGIGFAVTTSGTYYLDVTAWAPQVGGYVLQSDAPIDLSTRDPLESLNWDTAPNVPFVDVDGVPTAYIYFADAGENFGVPEVTGSGTMLSEGWQPFQIAGVMAALQEYENLLGVQYVIVDNPDDATFRMMTTTNTTFGARFYNYDPAYNTAGGDFRGIGVFNNISGGFGTRPESLVKGGFSYGVVLHEFGHAHGIAHPHDTGGGSEVMVGVTGNASFGAYDLNQGVYTVMSYNEGWQLHPDGPTTQSPTGSVGQVIDHGWSLFGAFDVAVLKDRYGLADQNMGDTTYTLNDDYHTAYYNTIVDMGGLHDTIAYGGSLDAQIDLQAATLDYSPIGGGAISFLHNVAGTAWQQQVKGGYTIANGVVIENATGGSGNDLLLGNSADNVLTGNGGNDNLAGRGGVDVYRTGAGADTVLAFLDSNKLDAKRGPISYDIITDFDGVTDKIDLSDLDAKASTTGVNDAFKWIGTSANKNAGDLSYKVYDSMNGAEKALGIEISDYSGNYSGKITVVMANVDGGAVDYAMILLGAPSLQANDFSL